MARIVRSTWLALALALSLPLAACGGQHPAATEGGTGASSSGAAGTGGAGGEASGASSGSAAGSGGAQAASAASASAAASSGAGGSSADPYQICVDTINMLRASINVAPLQRWTAEESCVDQEAEKDATTMTAHSAFGMCGETAEDECPNFNGPPAAAVTKCLAEMWTEGPGTGAAHIHYNNMSNPAHTQVACGFYTLPNGKVWSPQDFH